MQKIKLRTEESGKKLSAAYAPPKWSETAEEECTIHENKSLNLPALEIRYDVYVILHIIFYFCKSYFLQGLILTL